MSERGDNLCFAVTAKAGVNYLTVIGARGIRARAFHVIVSLCDHDISHILMRAMDANIFCISVLLASGIYGFGYFVVMLAGVRHIDHICYKIIISIF
jgi:hypothetical protein